MNIKTAIQVPVVAVSLGLAVLCADTAQVRDINPRAGPSSPGMKITVLGDGFSPTSVVYFGGFAARTTTYFDSSRLEAITPYLRPGEYEVLVETSGMIANSPFHFNAMPAAPDPKIDAALAMAEQGQTDGALDALREIESEDHDYQVRSFARFKISEIYFSRGDWLQWYTESKVYIPESGDSIQTYWPYGLNYARAHYLVNAWQEDPEIDVLLFDITVRKDVTGAKEPRLERGIVRARSGDIAGARADADECMKADLDNPGCTALAAFCAAMAGDKHVEDLLQRAWARVSRARDRASVLALIGEAEYVRGHRAEAEEAWSEAGKLSPRGSELALLAAKKHLKRGEQAVAAILLAEVIAMAPLTEQATEAEALLVGVPSR